MKYMSNFRTSPAVIDNFLGNEVIYVYCKGIYQYQTTGRWLKQEYPMSHIKGMRLDDDNIEFMTLMRDDE